jgi:dynein heavy chain
LINLEDRILKKLAEIAGAILSDEEIINILEASKIKTESINQRMEESRVTEKKINETREKYRIVATRGSALYFVIADLARIDPMYQYSLEYFTKYFKKRLEMSEQTEDVDKRLTILVNDITVNFYKNICRGLFEKDKQLFSFMIAAKIQMGLKKISSKEWNYFLRGPAVVTKREDEAPDFISAGMWALILSMEELDVAFIGISKTFHDPKESAIWKQIMELDDVMDIEFPGGLHERLSTFQKLVVLKVIREEKAIMGIKKFVKGTLGAEFIESPSFDLKGSFMDSTNTTPIIFILSPGADPMSSLLNLAKEMEMDGPRFKILSLGQGQGEIAEEYIKSGRRNGDWVCLQNCHLAATWMTAFERIQEQAVESEIHGEYRLWLTSMPTPKFPIPILQSGIKLTNEPPKGLKSNLRRTFNEIDENVYESSSKPKEFKKLLFSLAFFHATILERRKFGAIGWNIPYEWMNSDFETCFKQLIIYLEEQPQVPYVTLRFLIAEINYGGRVTDDKDVRLITCLLGKYFSSDVMDDKYKFSDSGVYSAPEEGQIADTQKYITDLPLEDDPDVFGLHPFADTTYQQKTVREFMATLLDMNPKQSDKSGGGLTNDEIVANQA